MTHFVGSKLQHGLIVVLQVRVIVCDSSNGKCVISIAGAKAVCQVVLSTPEIRAH